MRIELDELVATGPMMWWIEGCLFKMCDWLDDEMGVLAMGLIAVTLPISFVALFAQMLWWLLVLIGCDVAFPFLLVWKLWRKIYDH